MANITAVDIRDDKSVLVYYDTGFTKAYKSADVLPKTALTWLEAHQEPVTVKTVATPDGIAYEVSEVPFEASQEPVEATSIVPVVNCPPAVVDVPEQPQNRIVWYIPTIPYLLALGAVEAVLYMVSVLGVIAGIAEVVSPYVIRAVKLGIEVGKDLASLARAWWRESMAWRAELIAEWEPAEWEVA